MFQDNYIKIFKISDKKEVSIVIKIRPIQESDKNFLWDMLFEMVYFPEGERKPNKEEFLSQPDIYKYLDGFGLKNSDSGFVAENDKNELIGAAWFRLFDNSNKGYGYINDDTPELSIAVLKEYRGKGIGSKMLKALIEKAKLDGYPAISLSVDPENIAFRLYIREGFKKVGVLDTSWTMKLDLLD